MLRSTKHIPNLWCINSIPNVIPPQQWWFLQFLLCHAGCIFFLAKKGLIGVGVLWQLFLGGKFLYAWQVCSVFPRKFLCVGHMWLVFVCLHFPGTSSLSGNLILFAWTSCLSTNDWISTKYVSISLCNKVVTAFPFVFRPWNTDNVEMLLVFGFCWQRWTLNLLTLNFTGQWNFISQSCLLWQK